MRLVVAINDRYTINRDGRRPMVRSIDRCILRPIVRAIVAAEDRWYDQSWGATTDRTINRNIVRPIVRSIIATYDRSYDQSGHHTLWNRKLRYSQTGSYDFLIVRLGAIWRTCDRSVMLAAISKKRSHTAICLACWW